MNVKANIKRNVHRAILAEPLLLPVFTSLKPNFLCLVKTYWNSIFSSSCCGDLRLARRRSLITRHFLYTASEEKPCVGFATVLSPLGLVFAAQAASLGAPSPQLGPRCRCMRAMTCDGKSSKTQNRCRPRAVSPYKTPYVGGLFSPGWMCFGLFFLCWCVFIGFHGCLCEDQVHSFTQQYTPMSHSLHTGRAAVHTFRPSACQRSRGSPLTLFFVTLSPHTHTHTSAGWSLSLENLLTVTQHGLISPQTRSGLGSGSHAPLGHCCDSDRQ